MSSLLCCRWFVVEGVGARLYLPDKGDNHAMCFRRRRKSPILRFPLGDLRPCTEIELR